MGKIVGWDTTDAAAIEILGWILTLADCGHVGEMADDR